MAKEKSHQEKLIDEIQMLAQSEGVNTVFTTFLEITANSIAAQMDPEHAEIREARYDEIASGMTPEALEAYARMFGQLCLAVLERQMIPAISSVISIISCDSTMSGADSSSRRITSAV